MIFIKTQQLISFVCIVLHGVLAQDFMKFITPFLGSGISPSGGGGSSSGGFFGSGIGAGAPGASPSGPTGLVQGLLSQFTDVGNDDAFSSYAGIGKLIGELASKRQGAPTNERSNPSTNPLSFLTSSRFTPQSPSPSLPQFDPSKDQQQRHRGHRKKQRGNKVTYNNDRPLPSTGYKPRLSHISYHGNNKEPHYHYRVSIPSTEQAVPALPSASPGPLPAPQLPSVSQLPMDAGRVLQITSYSNNHQHSNGGYPQVKQMMDVFFQMVSPHNDDNNQKRRLPRLRIMDDGTELGRNRPLTNDLFESDMVLTVEQMKSIIVTEAERRKQRGSRRRFRRKVITGGVYRWPKDRPIPYRFDSADESWRRMIREALDRWQSETCVRFVENAPGHDHIVFFRGSGCYSSVGKTGGAQQISIGHGCENTGIIMHEVGHSLGFWHEQSRPDRDEYIAMDEKYIARGTWGNFERRDVGESEDMGLPYDLGSVMHYGSNAFTIDWDHHTIKTRDSKYSHTIGQRESASFIDVKQINRLYCHHRCPNQLPCSHGGYADPNSCNTCKCPNGLGGPTCSNVMPSACGGELSASESWQQLTHSGNDRCYWRIQAPNGRVRFVLDTVHYDCELACASYVEIKHGSDFQQTGFRSCCAVNEVEVLSEQSEIVIIADGTKYRGTAGFGLRYIRDGGQPLPVKPPPAWVPGQENRNFKGQGHGGPIEKFILNAIPKVRDPNRPTESIASLITDFVASSVLGASRD